MDFIKTLNLGTAAELVISAAIILALVQAIKQTKVNNKWLPWIAMGLGVGAGLVSVVATKDSNWVPAALQGLLLGAATSGLFDGVKGLSATAFGTTESAASPASLNEAQTLPAAPLTTVPEEKHEGQRDAGAQLKTGPKEDTKDGTVNQ
ncbi:phage holin family protein [Schleiferilactobacillus harbinensis]|uniref:phage holin family protein n=1 Tax=Schleiferilactobacillus harbinensis TaxID=304207 RepID=UPI00168B9A87|nr:hypothetical protein [Schleiferilactobacillus harbinensis]